PYRFHDTIDGEEAGGKDYNPKTCTNITKITRGGAALGTFWYDCYYPGASIRMHVKGFAPNWVNREFLWMAFDYAFNQLGVPKVLGFIKGYNEEVTRFATKLGFRPVTFVDAVFPNGEPLIILELTKKECRWLDY